ncbi:MAG: ATP-binding protein [Myxococcaceae bacterium]
MRRLVMVSVFVVAITAGHYSLSPGHGGIHDLMQRLYYVPIVLAGLWFGLRGGAITATTSSVLYLPHIFMQWGGAHSGNVEKFLELVLFVAIGVLTGLLADRLRAAHDGQRRAYASLLEKSAQLLRAEEQLGRAERLAALGELSAELAHEIRNPLGAIKGAAEIFRDRLGPQDPLREFAVIQCKEADRLDKVLEGCLAVARRRDAPEEPGSVLEAAQEAVRVTSPEASRAGVELVLDVATGLPRVQASPGSLRQVFLNLALNAIQAMPSGGRLRISGSKGNGRIRVAFADTGPGISAGDREQVFQPFFSRRANGTGLGLAISRRLVAGAGGSIGVESQPGQGATFVVELPAAQGVL